MKWYLKGIWNNICLATLTVALAICVASVYSWTFIKTFTQELLKNSSVTN